MDGSLTRNTVTTTYGVGELSALNGIAGAYTEQVKVIHVVGTTAIGQQEKHQMIHHCLGPSPDHKVGQRRSTRSAFQRGFAAYPLEWP